MRRISMPRLASQIGAALLTFVAACAPTWQHAQAATMIGAMGMLACDGGTTDQFLASHSGWSEGNPILGEHPSDARLWGYLGAIAAGLAIANSKLSPKWAIVANVAVMGVEAEAIGYNMHVGASACGMGQGGPWLDDVNAPAASASLGHR